MYGAEEKACFPQQLFLSEGLLHTCCNSHRLPVSLPKMQCRLSQNSILCSAYESTNLTGEHMVDKELMETGILC